MTKVTYFDETHKKSNKKKTFTVCLKFMQIWSCISNLHKLFA